MTARDLWLIRHGETEWSALGQHTSWTELELTEEGVREVLAVKPLLRGRNFSLVLSSPRSRAVRTAELAGFEPTIDEDLKEWDYGALEGMTIEEIRKQYPGWSIWGGPWPGGEHPDDVAARADRVIERALAVAGPEPVLLFAHGHILRALGARWLRRPPTDGYLLKLGTATVSILGWEHGEPVVSNWNVPADTGQLG
ncbi:MAG TPA: histidine phosphatase family protein [Acidimicrobiales bacterium]|nr:histidine phosphatase family protein [Acidimicrobiales bacterium]